MSRLIRCPSCGHSVRAGADDSWRLFGCPECGRPLPADADQPPADPAGPTPALVGLALLPWGIPFGWLLLAQFTGAESVFTFALPVAAAAGLCGVCLGLAAARWSQSTRAVGILAVSLSGYVTVGGLYFVRTEWVEAVRRGQHRDEGSWQPYRDPGGAYEVRFPGPAGEAESPLPGWELTAVGCATDRPAADVFTVAHGPAPVELRRLEDKDWFAAARQGVLDAAGGEVRSERVAPPVPRPDDKPVHAREYVIRRPDGITNRVVRVVRGGRGVAFVLAAEGAFLPADGADVQKFFDSFRLTPKPKPRG